MNEAVMVTELEPPESTPRVYMDDGEFYVSSEEVRIGERKWKFEDVEYVDVEYSTGWVAKALFSVFYISAIALTLMSSHLYIAATLFLLFFSISIINRSKQEKRETSFIFDNFTGYIRIHIYLRNSDSDSVRFAGYSHKRKSVEKWSDAVKSAFKDRIMTAITMDGEVSRIAFGKSGKLHYIDAGTGTAYLYNMKLPLKSIKRIAHEYNTYMPLSDGLLSAFNFFVFLIVYAMFLIETRFPLPMFFFLFYFPVFSSSLLNRREPPYLLLYLDGEAEKRIVKGFGDLGDRTVFGFAKECAKYKRDLRDSEKLAKKLINRKGQETK